MADTIKVPGIGPVKKPYVYAGAGIAAGIVIFAYWRSSQATGEETGDEFAADETDTGEEIGTDLGVPEYDYALGAGGYDYGSGTSYPSYQYPNTGPPVRSGSPTTNAEWAQAAREQLENEGVDSSAASSAIGTYLAKLCVSSAQADLVRRANAMLGQPPQGTYAIVTCPAPTPNKPTPPKPSTPKPGGTAGKVTGLRAVKVGTTSVLLDWQPAAHSHGYGVYVNGVRKASPRFSSQTIKGLRRRTTYTFGVVPVPDAGYRVPSQTTIRVKTK